MRLNSLRSLLATMITPHNQTLVTLTNHWHKMVQVAELSEQKTNDLALVLGPLLMRPLV